MKKIVLGIIFLLCISVAFGAPAKGGFEINGYQIEWNTTNGVEGHGFNMSCNSIIGASYDVCAGDGAGSGDVSYTYVQNYSNNPCPAGTAVYDRHQNGTYLCRSLAAGSNTWWPIYTPDLINDSQVLKLNWTTINDTIDDRATGSTDTNETDRVNLIIDTYIPNNATQTILECRDDIDNNITLQNSIISGLNETVNSITNFTSNQVDAITNANLPNSSNPFATLYDLTTGNVTVTTIENIRNTDTVTLSPGDPVYYTAYNAGLNRQEVQRANYSSTESHVDCLILGTVAQNANGQCVVFGNVIDVDTSAWSFGDDLYLAEFGNLTTTKPTSADIPCVQKVGMVLRSHATLGVIEVFGAGRCNDVPNDINIEGNISGDYALFDDWSNASIAYTQLSVCSEDQIIKINSGAWTCSADNAGSGAYAPDNLTLINEAGTDKINETNRNESIDERTVVIRTSVDDNITTHAATKHGNTTSEIFDATDNNTFQRIATHTISLHEQLGLWGTNNFSASDVSNWDTAFGWGDHSGQNYLDLDTYPNTDVDDTDDLMTNTSWSGDLTGTGSSPNLNTDSVSDNEIDYSTVTLSDITDDVGYTVNNTDLNVNDKVIHLGWNTNITSNSTGCIIHSGASGSRFILC